MTSTGQRKKKGRAGVAGEGDRVADGVQESKAEGEEGERDGSVTRGEGGLKGFVRRMDGQSHRMVEMRLAVVAACAVAFRLLLYDNLEGRREGVAWSALSLVAGQ